MFAYQDINDEAESRSWDCWVSDNPFQSVAIYHIRCIPDMDVLSDDTVGEIMKEQLKSLHSKLHSGYIIELDKELHSGKYLLINEYIKAFKIYQYPYVESWREKRPEMLVEANFCKKQKHCKVNFFH